MSPLPHSVGLQKNTCILSTVNTATNGIKGMESYTYMGDGMKSMKSVFDKMYECVVTLRCVADVG